MDNVTGTKSTVDVKKFVEYNVAEELGTTNFLMACELLLNERLLKLPSNVQRRVRKIVESGGVEE